MSSHQTLGERTITEEWGGGSARRITTRVAFRVYDRLLGTETVREERYQGQYRGWTWKSKDSTHAFADREEVVEWLDSLVREHEIAQVKANGGTKLVILT